MSKIDKHTNRLGQNLSDNHSTTLCKSSTSLTFLTPPVVGADLRAACGTAVSRKINCRNSSSSHFKTQEGSRTLVASCFRGALPPVDLRAVCFVRAMPPDKILGECHRIVCALFDSLSFQEAVFFCIKRTTAAVPKIYPGSLLWKFALSLLSPTTTGLSLTARQGVKQLLAVMFLHHPVCW